MTLSDPSPTPVMQGPRKEIRYTLNHRLNRVRSPTIIYLFEKLGYYDISVIQRLIGHYYLFRCFRAFDRQRNDIGLPQVRAYVIRYLATYKRLTIPFLSIRFPDSEAAAYNNILLNEAYNVLEDFLLSKEEDLEEALARALEQLSDPIYFHAIPRPAPTTPPVAPLTVNINNTHNNQQYNQYNHYEHTEVNMQSVVKEGAKGKEKGVFSKKQMLIFFDLIATNTPVEK